MEGERRSKEDGLMEGETCSEWLPADTNCLARRCAPVGNFIENKKGGSCIAWTLWHCSWDRGCFLSFFTSLFRYFLLPTNRRFHSLLIFCIPFVLNILRFSFFPLSTFCLTYIFFSILPFFLSFFPFLMLMNVVVFIFCSLWLFHVSQSFLSCSLSLVFFFLTFHFLHHVSYWFFTSVFHSFSFL